MGNRKVQKHKSKPCDLCGGSIIIVRYSEEIDGVSYDEEYEECQECFNKIKSKRNGHKPTITKYDW